MREFSFISQHMIVQKSILREMLGRIESNFPGPNRGRGRSCGILKARGPNLFSEYEMFGHFVKNHYPLAFRIPPPSLAACRVASRHWPAPCGRFGSAGPRLLFCRFRSWAAPAATDRQEFARLVEKEPKTRQWLTSGPAKYDS